MQVLKTLSIAALLASLGTAGVQAQSLRNADEPAEFPPSGYASAQYVDSRGCVYVRAGSGDAVQWVPRVSRDRKVLCGFKPSLAAAQAKLPVIPDAESPKSAKAPLATVATTTTMPSKVPSVPVTPSPPVAAPVKAVAATMAPHTDIKKPTMADAETVGATCGTNAAGQPERCTPQSVHPVDYILKRLPAGMTVRTANGGTLTTTEPTLVRIAVKGKPVAAAPAPKYAPKYAAVTPPASTKSAVPVTSSKAGCVNLSSSAAAYMVSSMPVRCAPQAVHPSTYTQQRAAQTLRTNTAVARVVEAARTQGVAVVAPVSLSTPKGYTHAFSDGRLNTQRGPRTSVGDFQMAQVWTNTVPAYPVGHPKGVSLAGLFRAEPRIQPAVQTRISTKSVAPRLTPVAPRDAGSTASVSGLRYVQVGTFGTPENAQASIGRLSALGLPVSSQMLTRKGRALKIVLAGPFATPEQTLQAVGQARAAGFGDAFARK